MFSETCNVNKPGVQRVDRVGPFVVIANKQRYEDGKSRKFALVHEDQRCVHSVGGTERSAVVYAQKRLL